MQYHIGFISWSSVFLEEYYRSFQQNVADANPSVFARLPLHSHDTPLQKTPNFAAC